MPGTLAALTGWGAAIADYDDDGVPDVLLPDRPGAQLYRGEGGGRLVFDPNAVPAFDGVPSVGASAADVDGDGDLDLFLARDGPDALWLNDGTGRFTDATPDAMRAFGYGSRSGAWGDYDGDGDLDLFVATFWTAALHPDPEDDEEYTFAGDPNQLWENLGGGQLADRSELLVGASTRTGFSYIGGWWDVDGDGRPDLHLANDKGVLGYTDALLHNAGGTFEDVSAGSGLDLGIQAMGLGAADLNHDGVPDFFLPDWRDLHLMLSDGAGGWYDAATALGLTLQEGDDRAVGWGGELVDLDNDGDDDLLADFGVPDSAESEVGGAAGDIPDEQPMGIWVQGSDGHYTQVADTWGERTAGIGRAVVPVDLDGDGWLDFLRRDLAGIASVRMGNCNESSWLTVELRTTGPNTRGIGARIEVDAGGSTQRRWITAGSTGIASSGPPEAHFGLAAVETVDAVRVTWPDGEEVTFEGVAARQKVRILRD